jgi:nicotinamide mononucleotide transporter
MIISNWISNNYIEVFGAVTGILYVILEIRQNIWLWPVGIVTSAVYIWVFFTSRFYADMSLQGYYLVISCLGWYWWSRRAGHRAQGTGHKVEERVGDKETEGQRDEETEGKGEEEKEALSVTRIDFRTGVVLAIVFVFLYLIMFFVLSRLTDSPVPEWDSFITSLSIVATWMLARKIYEHWFLWILVNSVSAALFIVRGLYPTSILYMVYGSMSFVGLVEWKRTINPLPGPQSVYTKGKTINRKGHQGFRKDHKEVRKWF